MKKTVCLLFFSAALAFMLAGQTITVTSPAAGNTWGGGGTYIIKWTKTGSMIDQVMIHLRNGSGNVLKITDNTANDEEYSWTVPASVTPGQYYIRVRTVDNAVTGNSGTFSIAPPLPPPPPPPPATLAITAPNGGEKMTLDSPQVITWNAVNVPGKVRIELARDQGPVLGVIFNNLDADSGSQSWGAGKYGFNQTAPPGVYRLIIRSLSNFQLSDQSDQPFTLKSRIMAEHAPVAMAKPDLVMCLESAVYLPLKTLGYFHVHVRNAGPGVARAPFVVDTYCNGALISHRVFENDLGPGESRWVVSSGWSSLNEATRPYSATADPDNQINETDEGNNTSSGLFIIEYGNPTQNTVIRCGDNTTIQGN